MIWESIRKVRHFFSLTTTCPRCFSTLTTQLNPSNTPPTQPPALDPAPIAASQLSRAQQWVSQNDLRCPATIDFVKAPPGTDVLKFYEGLRKVESSLAIQLRTRIYGLDAFHFLVRVPSVPSPLYSCCRGQQTVKHVLIFCPQIFGARHKLRDDLGHLPDISRLLGTADGLLKTTRRVTKRGIFGQLSGARGMLYGPPNSDSPSHNRF